MDEESCIIEAMARARAEANGDSADSLEGGVFVVGPRVGDNSNEVPIWHSHMAAARRQYAAHKAMMAALTKVPEFPWQSAQAAKCEPNLKPSTFYGD